MKAVEIVGKDPNCDAVLAILVPQGMAEPGEAAEKLKSSATGWSKPLLASWMGGPAPISGRAS